MSFTSNGGGIQPHERMKYESIFNSLDPVAGKLPGEKVRPVLIKSNLPIETLGKVWDLSDIDKDGFLDKEEFNIAMHLVYRAIDNEPVPSVLPLSLIPPTKIKSSPSPVLQQQQSSLVSKSHLPGAVCVLPPSSPAAQPKPQQDAIASSGIPQSTAPKPIYISTADRARYTTIFQQHKDQFGFISGESAKLIFLQSQLSQTILADIWSMCDPLQQGRLKQEQFLLAMHLISQTVKGIEIPKLVSPDYLLTSHDSGFGDDGGSISDGGSSVGDTAAIRELDALNKEIEDLRKEKEILSSEIQTKEQSIKSTGNVVKELQEKLDKDSNTLAQLERDKTDTQTRLEELEQNRKKLDVMLSDVQTKLEQEKANIQKLNTQLATQQATAEMQEKELSKLNGELADLKKEQTQLEQRLQSEKQQEVSMSIKIGQAKQEQEKVKQEIENCKRQNSMVSMNISEMEKEINKVVKEQPTTKLTNDNLMLASQSVFSMDRMQENIDDLKSDLNENMFKPEEVDAFKSSSAAADPFAGSDPFGDNNKSDPFADGDLFASNNNTTTTNTQQNNFDTTQTSTTGIAFPPSTTTTNDNNKPTDLFPPSTDPFGGGGLQQDAPVDNPFNDVTASGGGDPFMTSSNLLATGSSVADPFNDSGATADPFKGSDPFASSDNPTSMTSSKPFDNKSIVTSQPEDASTTDPFAGSDPFSSSAGATTDVFEAKFPPSDTSGGFPSSNSADPFNDNKPTSTDNNDDFFAFNDFKKQTPALTGGSATSGGAVDDPWGSTSATLPSAPSADPFGDAFGSSNVFSSSDNSFGGKPWGGVNEKKSTTPTPSGTTIAEKPDKQKRAMTESEQLAWAQQESKREEERRKKMQQQEQEDLELAIQLSKQQS